MKKGRTWQLVDRNDLKVALVAFFLVVRSSLPLLTHDTRFVLDTFGRTGGTNFALGPRVSVPVRSVETSTSTTDTFSLPVANLSVRSHTRILTDGTFTGSSSPSGSTDTLATVTFSVFGTNLPIVAGTVEIVALAEFSRNLLFRILKSLNLDLENLTARGLHSHRPQLQTPLPSQMADSFVLNKFYIYYY